MMNLNKNKVFSAKEQAKPTIPAKQLSPVADVLKNTSLSAVRSKPKSVVRTPVKNLSRN